MRLVVPPPKTPRAQRLCSQSPLHISLSLFGAWAWADTVAKPSMLRHPLQQQPHQQPPLPLSPL
jgi:hypothetical protein